MGSLVGFTLELGLAEENLGRMETSQHHALRHFTQLTTRMRIVGESRLYLWGHADFDDCIHIQPDGSVLALIGSPVGSATLRMVAADLQTVQQSDEFTLPWDGRVILLRISADGKNWMMWNDWLGSIPVFYSEIERGRIASTLEPVTVAASGYTSDDFFMPGLVSLLINGHYLSDWTLYKNMKVIPPDSMISWDKKVFHAKKLWTVEPSQDRWEAGWDDLVDEMHELSHNAIADVLKTQSKWILPLSSGFDSRLIAGVAAEVGANVYSYAWGGSNTTDVIYSRQIAKTLGFPWKRIDLPDHFLVEYTPQWADWFGSAMHFHGMYQMAFLDQIQSEPAGMVLSGFIGDVLAGDDVVTLSEVHSSLGSCQIYDDWYVHWTVKELPAILKIPIKNVLHELASSIDDQIKIFSGRRYQNLLYLELWSRQRFFTNYQSTLLDYYRGVANPFMNREYARFCMSLPRAALDKRRLLGDVFRRYYGRLAVIPGTYAKDPFVLTGKYLTKRRIVKYLPAPLHHGPFAGFNDMPLRMDMDCIQATGKDALWPLFDIQDRLSEWLDVDLLEQAYQTIMRSKDDIRPLRKLQSAQTLAYRLL